MLLAFGDLVAIAFVSEATGRSPIRHPSPNALAAPLRFCAFGGETASEGETLWLRLPQLQTATELYLRHT